jgi:hypothetical protein
MCLVGLKIFNILPIRPAGASARNANDFNVPIAIPGVSEDAPRHDHAGRRLRPAPGPYPSRKPGSQATKELLGRGDASSEKGGPPRPNLPAKQRDGRALDLRPGTTCGAVPCLSLAQPARHRHGPGRAPPRGPCSFGAALQGRRLPRTRGGHPRRRGRPDVRCDFRRRRHKGFRPAVRGRPASFPIHRVSRRCRLDGRSSCLHSGIDGRCGPRPRRQA